MTQEALKQVNIPAVFKGWKLTGTLSVALVLISIGTMSVAGPGVEGIRWMIRVTAQTSFLLFTLAFTASALYKRWPNTLTHWQRGNRRYIGVSFAVSHFLHAIGVIIFAQQAPQLFHEVVNRATYVFGGLAYLFIIAMTLTSFDKTAAWLGPRAWRILHVVGAYDIWLTFFVSESKRAIYDPFHYPFVAISLLALGIRLLGRSSKS